MNATPPRLSKRAAMLAAITRHGQSLLAAFPNATERDPDTLARKLRRIETRVYQPVLGYCNGDTDETTVDAACVKALADVRKVLGLTPEDAQRVGLFVNKDPRGYALKVSDAWTRAHNETVYRDTARKVPALHSDWGGYGILAPDLTNAGD